MTEEQIRALITKLLAERDAAGTAEPQSVEVEVDTAELQTMLSTELKRFLEEDLPGAIDTHLTARDAPPADPSVADPPADPPVADPPVDDRADFDAEVQARSDLIVQVRTLMPSEFDYAGKTAHDILVAAAGDEVEGAADRSVDYLQAKVEGILERRAKVQSSRSTGQQRQANRNGAGLSSPVSPHSVVVARLKDKIHAITERQG